MRNLIVFLFMSLFTVTGFLARGAEYRKDIFPILDRFCFECHSGDEAEAEINFESFESVDDLRRNTKVWVKVDEMISSRQMPPKKSDQLTESERDTLAEWVQGFLIDEARSRAGDPGRVVLRRLNNDEYNYTVRDLTGVMSLDPTREFPVDGAAGEGFTNAGDALVMSPALVIKFLEAAKKVARHVVLIPEGIRFSEHLTERDLADELMGKIRNFYAKYVNVGIRGGDNWNDSATAKSSAANRNGSLPLKHYVAATLRHRKDLTSGAVSVKELARDLGLNAKYLGHLWDILDPDRATPSSFLLSRVRNKWIETEGVDPELIVEEIKKWQQVLWRFESIGHIGRAGGPAAWMNPQSPVSTSEKFSFELSEPEDGSDIVVYLTSTDLGDGNGKDFVCWKNPRLVGGGKPDLLMMDVPGLADKLEKIRNESLSHVAKFLEAAALFGSGNDDIDALAVERGLDPVTLKAWLDYLAIGPGGPVEVEGLFQKKTSKGGGYDFVGGWGTPATPSVISNWSDKEVRIPGISRPHSVVAHPSPTTFAAIGWKSPIEGIVTVEARIGDAHPECGNGVEWWVQQRSSRELANLGQGDFERGGSSHMKPKTVAVRKGELISIIIGPRQGQYSCDLTHVDMTVVETSGAKREWDLAKEVSPRIHEGNPLKDLHGHHSVWHFYKGSVDKVNDGSGYSMSVPPGSLLAQWQEQKDPSMRAVIANRVQDLVAGKFRPDPKSPDTLLLQQLRRISVPGTYDENPGLVDPDPRFGKHPDGQQVSASDIVTKAPSVIELRIPAELARGRTLIFSAQIDVSSSDPGMAQVTAGMVAPELNELLPTKPIVVAQGSDPEKKINEALNDFRDLFPASICYPQIVPIDEVVTLALYFREDEPLQRLMLNEAQKAELDRLWEELLYVTKEPFKLEVAYEQIVEFSTQDRPDLVISWKPYKEPLMKRVEAFRERLVADESVHLNAVLDFAERAWRRPLSEGDKVNLRTLYNDLRGREIPHQETIRLTVARVLTSPAFLYRRERAGPAENPTDVTGYELATRLSYFLWSSAPDHELSRAAQSGELTDDEKLLFHARRMLRDPKVRRMAEQFACQWLHVRGFDRNDNKNEKLYPNFAQLRGAMYEESLQFFEDMFRNDGSVLDIIEADHTFLNEALAGHYGIQLAQHPQPGVLWRDKDGNVTQTAKPREWRRVEGIKSKGRGGVLGMATVLASNSGASRTSPILRGNWIYETLLGERLPRPPADVPDLPETVPDKLTARQLIEKHSSAKECAKCHEKIDPYGFALEQFDAVGRLRDDTRDTGTRLFDGTEVEGIEGLRGYLAGKRLDDFLKQFCRKILGYALGREMQLSDMLLLEEMQEQLKENDYRFSVAVESILTSPQFLKIRGQLAENED